MKELDTGIFYYYHEKNGKGASLVVSMGDVFWEASTLSIAITEGRYPLFLLCLSACKTPRAVLSFAQNMAVGHAIRKMYVLNFPAG